MTPGVRPGTRPAVVVLDNEAAQALARRDHPKHTEALAFLVAAGGRSGRGPRAHVCVPTVVRVEAGIDRRAPGTAAFNRLRIHDVALDRPGADRAAGLRHVGGSAVDACVAVTAGLSATASDVVVLTADLTDIPRLLEAAGVDATTRRI